MQSKEYIAVVQCHIVKERCSGCLCEKFFHDRKGGFERYDADKNYRILYMTCGGCCGKALHRKLSNMLSKIGKKDGLDKSKFVVQLSSCITSDSYHGPPCPHLDYLRELIGKLGLDIVEGTVVSKLTEERRQEGIYKS